MLERSNLRLAAGSAALGHLFGVLLCSALSLRYNTIKIVLLFRYCILEHLCNGSTPDLCVEDTGFKCRQGCLVTWLRLFVVFTGLFCKMVKPFRVSVSK